MKDSSIKEELSYKLSYIFMGLYHGLNGQKVKGTFYFLIEIVFVLFMSMIGIKNIVNLRSLGTQQQGWTFDEELGIEVLVKGDNSMLILIYGIVALVLLIVFIGFYISYLKSLKHISMLKTNDKMIPTWKEDVKAYWTISFISH